MSSGEASPSSRDSTNIFLPIGVNSTQLGQPELVIDTGIDIDKLIGSLVISLQAAQVASMELQRQSDHAETERVDAELALGRHDRPRSSRRRPPSMRPRWSIGSPRRSSSSGRSGTRVPRHESGTRHEVLIRHGHSALFGVKGVVGSAGVLHVSNILNQHLL